MDNPRDVGAAGPFEARYLAFLETITNLRPSLHRYCSRMTGSVMDGEDVVQDALFQAYRKLDTFDDKRPLAPGAPARQEVLCAIRRSTPDLVGADDPLPSMISLTLVSPGKIEDPAHFDSTRCSLTPLISCNPASFGTGTKHVWLTSS